MNQHTKREIKNDNSEQNSSNIIEQLLIILSMILLVLTIPISIFFSLMVLAEFQRAVVFRLGRLRPGDARGPGLVFVMPCIDYMIKVDLRTVSYDVPVQELLTKDHVTISLDAVVYYRIFDPLKSVIQVQNVHFATKLLAQTTLRNIAGQKHVLELMSEKDSVSLAMALILKKSTIHWGVYVERVEIKDVRLPQLLQRAMAAEAEAIREARAKIVAAEGELNASKALRAASDVIASNPIALQLRYLQTVSLITGDQNRNIIFPFPVNLVRLLLGGKEVGANVPPTQPASNLNLMEGKIDEALDEAFQMLDQRDET